MAEASAIPGPSQGSSITQGYSDSKFIAIMAEVWQLKINPQEFQHIKPELVQKIYYSLLKDIGINLETLNQIPAELLDIVQSTEDYIGALRLSMLASHMRKHLKKIYNDDSFRLADVINPKPKRTRKFFAMIYNFMVFTEEFFQKLEEKEGEVNLLIERREKMNTKLQKIQQLIDDRKEENTRSEVAKEEELRRMEENNMRMEKCQEEKSTLKGLLDKLNLLLTSLNTAKKDKELKALEMKDEVQKLEGLVIQPGEQEKIRMMDKKIASVKEDKQGKKEHLNLLQQKMKTKTSVKEKIDKIISALQEIELERSKTEELKNSLEIKISEMLELQEKIRDQESQNMKSIEALKLEKDNCQSMLVSWDHKKISLEMELKERKGVLEDLYRKLTEDDIAYNDGINTINELEMQLNQAIKKFSGVNTMMKENYKIMLNAMEQENVDLNETLSEVAECVEEFKKLG
ncbi:kinetochore protein Nuf2-like [Portunus trituberculatus]|nr:kinetochore protein Nuf2-like [Portunus trituberculatus]XP_045127611.1 kinetochore protein Nuf2-like [Portunus trituberculatus]